MLSYLSKEPECNMTLCCSEWTGTSDEEVKKDLELCYRMFHSARAPKTKKKQNRKEASSMELRQYKIQFWEAKQSEIKSWIDNEVYELIDMRKQKVDNFVTGRWVLTVKNDQHGNMLKFKARWVLRGFQDLSLIHI